jgi:hypothetical protein
MDQSSQAHITMHVDCRDCGHPITVMAGGAVQESLEVISRLEVRVTCSQCRHVGDHAVRSIVTTYK